MCLNVPGTLCFNELNYAHQPTHQPFAHVTQEMPCNIGWNYFWFGSHCNTDWDSRWVLQQIDASYYILVQYYYYFYYFYCYYFYQVLQIQQPMVWFTLWVSLSVCNRESASVISVQRMELYLVNVEAKAAQQDHHLVAKLQKNHSRVQFSSEKLNYCELSWGCTDVFRGTEVLILTF